MNAMLSHIPRSLRSYLELYQGDPDAAIERLEIHLEKRGPDAVGYFLLSWFYHHHDQQKKAVQSAWKAKIYAPGSPLMEKLHYYMAHPQKFEAWKPIREVVRERPSFGNRLSQREISDLDKLIHKLSTVESTKIKFDAEAEDERDLSEESARVEDIVTETLANIHIKQGNIKDAIHTYERLKQINAHKKEYYSEKIRELKKGTTEKERKANDT